MSLLYITSFTDKLYKVSGKKLIQSYINHKIKDPILVCYENFDYKSPDHQKIYTYDLNQSQFLHKWLNDNKDIIPDSAKKTKNPKIFKKMMLRKPSLFFRKIASLQHTLETYSHQFDYLIWIDCDCIFKQKLTKEFIIQQFNNNNYAMFFHQGKSREHIDAGIEAGLMGFNLNHGGSSLLKKIFNNYVNREFINYRRWDDGYIIRRIIKTSREISTIDLTPNCKNNNPINTSSPFKNYIKHDKGKHRRMKLNDISDK